MRTALYDWHLAHGARMVDFAGWDMPIQYSTIIEEHHAVRKQAGLFDISHMGRLWFDGADALDFLQIIATNDAATMKIGQVRYSLLCNETGGILDDVLIYRSFAHGWLMVVNASNREKILAWQKEQEFPIIPNPEDPDSQMPRIVGGVLAAESRRLFERWLGTHAGTPDAAYVEQLLALT